jgi:hypothetical protein
MNGKLLIHNSKFLIPNFKCLPIFENQDGTWDLLS